MEKEHSQHIDLFHQPRLSFGEAFTGPDILHPTHQIFTTTIKLRRDSIEKIISSSQNQPLTLHFADNLGTDIEVPITGLNFLETNNPDIITVFITGIFPLSEIYRIRPMQAEDSSFGY